ncbi:MAG: hypothetical protein Q4A82_01080 [Corynebacterium sp.]|nr:hypothetical protein [Corynebacterium sp.]
MIRRETLAQRKKIAKEIAREAQIDAPILTGEYRGGIDVEVHTTQVHVVDNDDLAIHKEYGTADTPAHGVLTHNAMKYGKYSGTRPR